MFKGKSNKEISLEILNTYNDLFSSKKIIQYEKCPMYIDSTPQMILNYSTPIKQEEFMIVNDDSNKMKVDNDDEPIEMTDDLFRTIEAEFIKQEKEGKKKSLPPLIPIETTSSRIYAVDICEQLAKYDKNNHEFQSQNHYLQVGLETYIMKQERKYYDKVLPIHVTKIIGRTNGWNINNTFNQFNGPILIGSYHNNMHFHSDTIDLLIFCNQLSKTFTYNPSIFDKVLNLFKKKLLIDSAEQIIQRDEGKNNDMFKIYIKGKQNNIKLCVYFVDKDSQTYEETKRNRNSIEKFIKSNYEVITLCKMIRLWRRKWNIVEILPEILDYIASTEYTYSIAEGFVKVLYIIYTSTVDVKYTLWVRLKLDEYFAHRQLCDKIKYACRMTFQLLGEKDYDKIFFK